LGDEGTKGGPLVAELGQDRWRRQRPGQQLALRTQPVDRSGLGPSHCHDIGANQISDDGHRELDTKPKHEDLALPQWQVADGGNGLVDSAVGQRLGPSQVDELLVVMTWIDRAPGQKARGASAMRERGLDGPLAGTSQHPGAPGDLVATEARQATNHGDPPLGRRFRGVVDSCDAQVADHHGVGVTP
jgi:hypothetical protein